MFKKLIKNIAITAVVLPVLMGSAFAAYPDKPIKMMIGYAPGSSTDIVGRIIANDLSLALKQPIIVENRGGAAGSLAADATAKSTPDGYTILFAQNGLAINVAANPKLPFNGQKDLLPVVGVAATPHILITNMNLPVKSVADLVAMLKADPGKMSYGSSGIGNSDHMAGELFLATAGLQAIHIPYKGGAPAATDLMGGQVDLAFGSIEPSLQLMRNQKIRPIAVTTTKRIAAAPEIPTVSESGVPGFETIGWNGIVAPANTPKKIVDRLNEVINQVIQEPAMMAKLSAQGVELEIKTPEALAQMIETEINKWDALVKRAGVKAD